MRTYREVRSPGLVRSSVREVRQGSGCEWRGPLRDGQSGIYHKSPKQRVVDGHLRGIITYHPSKSGSSP